MKDIDPTLHQRMAKAVDDGRIKCFNLLEGAADGDQDLMLMLTLPFMVRDLIAPEVLQYMYVLVCTQYVLS